MHGGKQTLLFRRTALVNSQPLFIPKDPCDPILNPDGHIALCVAENKLVADLIAERLIQPVTASVAFSDSEVYSYNSFLGLPVAREALAYFLVRRFLMPDAETVTKEEALQHINSQNVAFASGCAALLNYLFYGLGEPNDVCLIPAPYYAAFEKNMSVRSIVGKSLLQSLSNRLTTPIDHCRMQTFCC